MIKAIKEPDLESALREVIDAIRSKEVLLLIGECEVEYEGRGYTRLSAGERVVVVKSDGSLMVHRPTGFQPVNYQPRTDLVEAWIEPDGRLSLVAVRDKPREVLKVAFTKVSVLVRGRLADRGGFSTYFDEAEVRDYLFENPGILGEGIEVLAREVRTSMGVVDILARDAEGRYVVVEVKRGTATKDAVYQLYKYVVSLENEKGSRPRGILVAQSFTPAAIELLSRMGLEWRYIDAKKVLEYLKRRGRIGGLSKYLSS